MRQIGNQAIQQFKQLTNSNILTNSSNLTSIFFINLRLLQTKI